MEFTRNSQKILETRLKEKRKFIQVLQGPRQVGKTTIARSIFSNHSEGPSLYLSADEPTLSEFQNLNDLWQDFSLKVKSFGKPGLLIIDEIHKFGNWEKAVKARWDSDTAQKVDLKVVILGSAPLLIQKGLSESLAGRFETIDIKHWEFLEIHNAFGATLEQYIYFGGYPGPYEFIDQEDRWRSYIRQSLIETTISRDVLLLTRIDKPALLRQLFFLATQYSGQILSYQKMVGQLQDSGNTTTLAHYLELLSAVGFVKGLQKFTGSKVMSRGSSPKLQVYNTALMSALSEFSFEEASARPETWGRWVESAVGAYLLNKSIGTDYQISYWREGNFEVDFVVSKGKQSVAIEVKSGRKKETLAGINQIRKKHKISRVHTVGKQGIELEDFFKMQLADLF